MPVLTMSREDRRVVAGTMVGTTIEWYDFFIYSNAAALVFGKLFFEPLGPANATLAAFATVGVSFIFRPLGAIVAGHLGDRLGRRAMLVLTLFMMGGATVAVGLLPNYAQIGIAAPILLVVLRILQGFSAGGEWGGAALLAVEHAPTRHRGLFGSFPQMGVPAGMLLATVVLGITTATMSNEAFLAWGWRIPFVLSIVLFAVGLIIRSKVAESPVFAELQASKAASKMPLAQLFRFHWKPLILCSLTFVGVGVAGYMITGGYVLSYATTVLKMDRTAVLIAVSIAAAAWIATTAWGGALSDRIGRKRTFQIGFAAQILWVFPMFVMINSGNVLLLGASLVILTIGLGLSYGPQSAMFAEAFPARVRYSGASIAYALGSILGGAFAPMIATWLQTSTGTTLSVSAYLALFTLFALVAVTLLKDRDGQPLAPSHDGLYGSGTAETESGALLEPAAAARR
jgi:metabolite-proton symporter